MSTMLDGPGRIKDAKVSSGEILESGMEPVSSRSTVSGAEVWHVSHSADNWGPSLVWMPELSRRVAALAQRGDDWDSYGASPLQPVAVQALVGALKRLDHQIRREPSISLTDDGGLSCEWTSGEFSVDITASGTGMTSVYWTNDLTGEEWEGPLSEAPVIHKWLWQATSVL
jgi:hypothetical protein